MAQSWNDQAIRLAKLASQVEPELYGLTVAQATRRVAEHLGLSLLVLSPRDSVPLYFSPGEIVAYVQQNIIVNPATIEEVKD